MVVLEQEAIIKQIISQPNGSVVKTGTTIDISGMESNFELNPFGIDGYILRSLSTDLYMSNGKLLLADYVDMYKNIFLELSQFGIAVIDHKFIISNDDDLLGIVIYHEDMIGYESMSDDEKDRVNLFCLNYNLRILESEFDNTAIGLRRFYADLEPKQFSIINGEIVMHDIDLLIIDHDSQYFGLDEEKSIRIIENLNQCYLYLTSKKLEKKNVDYESELGIYERFKKYFFRFHSDLDS